MCDNVEFLGRPHKVRGEGEEWSWSKIPHTVASLGEEEGSAQAELLGRG